MKVNHRGSLETVEVTADGEGFCSHAGALLLVNLADRLGLTAGLSKALAGTRQRRSAHDDGEILRDLIVTLVAGGEHLSDLAALRDQPDLFGNVASDSTAFRLIERIGPSELEGLRAARKMARERAFALGARPEKIILDVDATLVGSHSDKEHAAGNYKGGYGFHPMLCYLDGSDGALDGILRPGNAGSNTGSDQTQAVELALQQLPEGCMEEEILVRGDSAACVHELIDFCRDAQMRFSVGHDLNGEVREAIAKLPEDAWVPAISQDGQPVTDHPSRPRKAYVAELTGLLDLSGWGPGARLLCRRERAHPGAQLSLIDTDGWRHQAFLTDHPASLKSRSPTQISRACSSSSKAELPAALLFATMKGSRRLRCCLHSCAPLLWLACGVVLSAALFLEMRIDGGCLADVISRAYGREHKYCANLQGRPSLQRSRTSRVSPIARLCPPSQDAAG